MSPTFTLVDALALGDLQVYLSRARRVEDGSVRLVAGGGVLAVYIAVLYPLGLLDETPTVLGLRTFALADPVELDAVVPIRSLLERVERRLEEVDDPNAAIDLALPLEVNTVTWAGISPPRAGWVAHAPVRPEDLESAAHAGIAEVAGALPEGAGSAVVQRVRSEVWGRPLASAEHIPAAAGFAAWTLGFLGDDPVRVFESGPWTRLTTVRGHVLVKRRSWTLAR